jgi:DNA-binding XRE family transcriptional regulator
MVKRERETDEMLDDGDIGGGGDRAALRKVVVPDNYCTQATYRRAVGRRLRTARVVLNISQQDVADAAGCSRNFVSGIERGAQGVDAYRLSLIALALRMRPRTLMEGDGWDSWMNGMHLGADG